MMEIVLAFVFMAAGGVAGYVVGKEKGYLDGLEAGIGHRRRAERVK